VQNVHAKFTVPNRPPDSSSLHLLKQLHWCHPVEFHIKFKIATLMFQALETGLPHYLNQQQLCPYALTRVLWSSPSKLPQISHTSIWLGSCSCCCLLILSGTHFLKSFISVILLHFPKTPSYISFSIRNLWCSRANHYPSASDSIFDCWHFRNWFTYLLTYLVTYLQKQNNASNQGCIHFTYPKMIFTTADIFGEWIVWLIIMTVTESWNSELFTGS